MAAKQALAKLVLSLERVLRSRTRDCDPDAIKSVLILEYMLPLGACVHLTPVFEALKRKPGLIVTVATRGLALGLLRHSPFIDHLIETPDPLCDLSAAAGSLKEQLRRRGVDPDCCLTGASDQRTRIALLGAMACRGWRGGFTVTAAIYQRPLAYDPGKSLIGNNLRLASLAGGPEGMLEPKVFFTRAEAARARELLVPVRAGGRPVLAVVSQNSGGQRTGWRDERWVQTIRHANEVLGYGVVYVGTRGDAAAIETLSARAGGTSLAGATSVPELAALLAWSDMVVSLDTGTMHVGRAVGVPMVVLGPSWQRPLEWLPLDKAQVRILRGEDRIGVPEGYRLDEIEAADVIAALDELTMLYPADDAGRERRVGVSLSTVDLLPG